MKNTYMIAKAPVSASLYTSRTLVLSAVLVSLLSYTVIDKVNALYYEPLTGQMDQGNKGVNVTRLQTFIAANPAIYPSGLITGYYGTLTAQAVIAFQNQNGLEAVGRVGPSNPC